MHDAADILNFWFTVHSSADWFAGKPEFDAEISERFGETHVRVTQGEAFGWRATAEGRLAEIIVLDQFSRQLFRNSAKAFAQDGMALALAQEAVAGGFDLSLDTAKRMFLYMPYQHSESLLVHQEGLRLFGGLEGDWLKYEEAHAEIIRRFGRFPKRNAALGRVSTSEELAYIAATEGAY